MKDAALRMALEALEYHTEQTRPIQRTEAAILTLREALANDALDKMAENARELGLDYEPVPENFIDALRFDVAMRDAALVQKPVAWGVFEDGNIHDDFYTQGEAEHMAYLKGPHAEVRPLYTTPLAQPAVPDAITDRSESPEYIQGWNDCRAEMLKGMKP
jgi:hypothetical protein